MAARFDIWIPVIVLIFIHIIWAILSIIAGWKIFTKAGIAGWKIFIPLYNGYLFYKISWKASIFFLLLGLNFIGLFMILVSSTVLTYLSIFILILVNSISYCIYNYKLAKAYGYGLKFTLGLLVLNGLFLLILGFGDAEYVGNRKAQ